jgi:hypothetical protein
MSDQQPNRPHRKPWRWWGATIVTLAGGVAGYFVAVEMCSTDGAEGDNCGALGVVLGVLIGLIVGIGAYAAVKMAPDQPPRP